MKGTWDLHCFMERSELPVQSYFCFDLGDILQDIINCQNPKSGITKVTVENLNLDLSITFSDLKVAEERVRLWLTFS